MKILPKIFHRPTRSWDESDFDNTLNEAMKRVDLSPDPEPEPEELQVARTHRILSASIGHLNEDRERLEAEIRERTEKLRQVNLVIKALTPADRMLLADIETAKLLDTQGSQQPQVATSETRVFGSPA